MVSGSHKPSSLPTPPHGPIWVTSPPLGRGALPSALQLPPSPAGAWVGAAHPSVPGVCPSLVPAVHSGLRVLRAGTRGQKKGWD